MKKIAFIMISVFLLTLSGCAQQKDTEKHYTYTGENENWSVEYKVTSTDNTAERSLAATYKGDISRLYAVKKLEISYYSSSSGGKIERDFRGKAPDEKPFALTSITEGGAVESKGETINVTINVDGNTETLELKSGK